MPNSKRTQKQILQGKDAHNDNIADTKIAAKIKNIEFAPSSLETIDHAPVYR